MMAGAASLTDLHTSKDGSFQYTIQPFDRDNETQIAFLRKRLSREVPSAYSSFLSVAMDAERSVVLLALRANEEATPAGSPLSSASDDAGKPIGLVIFDVSILPRTAVAALLWTSVLLEASGVGVGSRLLAEGEQDVKSLGARVVESPARWLNDFCLHVGYARCTNPVYYSTVCAARKNLMSKPTSAAATTAAPVITRPQRPHSHKAATPTSRATKQQSTAPHTRAEKRPREETKPAVSSSSAKKRRNYVSPPKRTTAETKPKPTKKVTVAPPSSAESSSRSSAALTSSSSSSASSSGDDDESEDDVLYEIPDVPEVIASGQAFLRLASPSDKKAWWNLILASTQYNVGGTELLPSTLDAAFRVVAVRQTDAALVGLVAMQEDGWITFLCADMSYQHKGLGSFLLFVALEWARRHGLPSASLSPLKFSLVRFYSRWGFVEDGSTVSKKKKTYHAGDAITMTRTFDPTFALIPNGATLQRYICDYDPSTEVTPQDGRTYYWYYPKRETKESRRETGPTAPAPFTPMKSAGDSDNSSSNDGGTPFSKKIRTLWSWSNLLLKA